MLPTFVHSVLRQSRLLLAASAILSVLASSAQAFSVNIYEFEVARTYVGAPPTPPTGPEGPGTTANVSVTDTFADGIQPPFGPAAFAPINVPNVYNVVGTLPAGSESGGALALNTAFGQVSFNPIAGGPVSLQRVRYQGLGLPVANNYGNYDWRVRGLFDLTEQSATGGYGIAFTNFSTAGFNAAVLGLRPGGAGGRPELRLYYANFGNGTETEYGDEDLDFTQSEIEIELRQHNGIVTGFWRYAGNQPFSQIEGQISLFAAAPNIVFNFGEFRAFAPVPEPGILALLGAGLAGIVFTARRRRR